MQKVEPPRVGVVDPRGCIPTVIALGSTPEGVMSHGEKSLLGPSGRAPSPCGFGSSGRGAATHRRESLTEPVSLPLGSNAVHPMVCTPRFRGSSLGRTQPASSVELG